MRAGGIVCIEHGGSMSYSVDQQKWLDMREYERQGKSHLCQAFKNCAVTMAGELVIGLTKSTKFWHYSARYLERDGKRLTGQVLQWDMEGKSTTGHSDLNMETIHKGVRVI